jgi:hypothetical protein
VEVGRLQVGSKKYEVRRKKKREELSTYWLLPTVFATLLTPGHNLSPSGSRVLLLCPPPFGRQHPYPAVSEKEVITHAVYMEPI